MTVLGSLEAIRPEDEAVPRKVGPVLPGYSHVPTLDTADRGDVAKARETLAEMIYTEAKRSRDRAVRLAATVRSSTTLAALAQTHAMLGESEPAIAAANEAIDLSVGVSEGVSIWLDISSARIAAEVLLRFDEAKSAYNALSRAPMTESLCLTFTSAATAIGECEEAENALKPYDSAMVAASRGYLRACWGDYQGAVTYLRRALREDPNDVDSLLNLAISLWNIGATQKATDAALRATRSAPGRKDSSLLYLEMLLAQKDIGRLTHEIALLRERMVVADAKFLEIQARTLIIKDDVSRAIPVLRKAVEEAKREGDQATEGRVLANLVRFNRALGRINREQASQQLRELLSKFPDNDVVAVNYAELAWKRDEAALLRKVLPQLESNTTEIRLAYLRHQIASLEGDNAEAAAAAAEWFRLEPNNVMAAIAAVVSIGIGQGRWAEAIVVAEHALQQFPDDLSLVNNSAYVLAMGGRAKEAISLLEPVAGDNFVLNATLGLAYLAHGDVGTGMQLYRNAAVLAEKVNPVGRSLLGVYQALIVRQLGLVKDRPPLMIEAMSPAPVELPEDWRERPDFLRLEATCIHNGYDWPPRI